MFNEFIRTKYRIFEKNFWYFTKNVIEKKKENKIECTFVEIIELNLKNIINESNWFIRKDEEVEKKIKIGMCAVNFNFLVPEKNPYKTIKTNTFISLNKNFFLDINKKNGKNNFLIEQTNKIKTNKSNFIIKKNTLLINKKYLTIIIFNKNTASTKKGREIKNFITGEFKNY